MSSSSYSYFSSEVNESDLNEAAHYHHFQIYENISENWDKIVYAAPSVEAARWLMRELRCRREFISDVATRIPRPTVVAVVENPVTYFLKGYVAIRYFGGLRYADRLRKLSHSARWMVEKGPSLKASLEAAVHHAQKKNGGPYNIHIAPQHVFFGVKGTGAFDQMLSSGVAAIRRYSSARDVCEVDKFMPAEAAVSPCDGLETYDDVNENEGEEGVPYYLQKKKNNQLKEALEKINSLFAKDATWASKISARILRAYDVDAYYHMYAVQSKLLRRKEKKM